MDMNFQAGVQSPGLLHQNPGFASCLWLFLGNKNTLSFGKDFYTLYNQSDSLWLRLRKDQFVKY